MAANEIFSSVVAALRSAAKHDLPAEILPEHSLVADLGFDSMTVALLGLSLEDELNRPILLDDWIGQHADPLALTVRSLCEYLNGDDEQYAEAAVS